MSRCLFIDANNKLQNRLSLADYEKLLSYAQPTQSPTRIIYDTFTMKPPTRIIYDTFSMNIELVDIHRPVGCLYTFYRPFYDLGAGEPSLLHLQPSNVTYVRSDIPRTCIESVNKVLDEIEQFISLDSETIVKLRLFQ